MKRPSFQFYPADWLGNPNLKRCTHAEKGMWADILCLLSDGDQFGILRWPLKEIATAIGVPVSALKGLVSKNVLKGSDTRCEAFVYVPRSGRKDGDPVTIIEEQDGPIWFSSRMVTDDYKASVREKNLPKSHQKSSPAASPMASKGEPEDVHHSAHPLTPAAPSSSSSPSGKDSEPIGSSAEPAPDLKAIIFGQGLDWLAKQTKRSPATLRSALGRAIKEHSEGVVIEAIGAAQREGAIDPLAFMEGVFRSRGGQRKADPRSISAAVDRLQASLRGEECPA